MLANAKDELRSWDGWVEARLRTLVARIEDFVSVRPWPKAITPPADVFTDGRQRCFYYIGVKRKQGGTQVNLQQPVNEFKAQVSVCTRLVAESVTCSTGNRKLLNVIAL